MPNWEKYKKKEKVVDAFAYKGGYVHGIIEDRNGEPMITAATGDTPVKKGDYIIRQEKGAYEVVPADLFSGAYIPIKAAAGEMPDCPCCGKPASVVKKDAGTGNNILFYVRCTNKECRLRTKSCGSKAEAIEIWSKRV